MTHFAKALAGAATLLALASPATAWEKTYTDYSWDKACKAGNCYSPYSSYMAGQYSYLVCADPHKGLMYVNGKLKCAALGTKAKK